MILKSLLKLLVDATDSAPYLTTQGKLITLYAVYLPGHLPRIEGGKFWLYTFIFSCAPYFG